MSKVAVVIDSTTLIPAELTQGLPIFTIPLHLIWDGEDLLDGVDIKAEEFYQRLKHSNTLPKTSQVTPEAFKELYGRLLDEGNDILSIHLSGELTATINSARIAQEAFPGAAIEPVDSRTGAMATGFHVLSAARAAAQGASLQECKEIAIQAQSHSNILFALDTLEYLHLGGRIGGAAAFVGSLLQIKPILETRNGRIDAIEKVRTMSKAIDRLVDILEEQIAGRFPVRLAALHADVIELGETILQSAKQRLGENNVVESILTGISPVLGVHLGPGAVGIAFQAGM
ncbi:MAG: DegV family protein [Chloroflexi bacterium]|nr:DegV family protein [Chloroflexota bacterium]